MLSVLHRSGVISVAHFRFAPAAILFSVVLMVAALADAFAANNENVGKALKKLMAGSPIEMGVPLCQRQLRKHQGVLWHPQFQAGLESGQRAKG